MLMLQTVYRKTVAILDVAWDCFVENSIKNSVRAKTGIGKRRKVQALLKLPTNLSNSLEVLEKMWELFQYLAKETVSVCLENRIVVSILNNTAI